MRVYISVDMEGIAGIGHPKPPNPVDSYYGLAVDLMVGETNAAIEGAYQGGATEVLVNDSHGSMYNLRPADLDPRSRLLQGQKLWAMVAGAGPLQPKEGPRFDVAIFVGYHARAGHPRGTLAHTYSVRTTETRLDGRATGEYGINAVVLGAWGVPVGLVAGDDALADEIEAWLPWAERVIVKVADGTNAANSVHPTIARELVRAGTERAVRRAASGELKVLDVGSPVVMEADYRRGIEADMAAMVPGNLRVGDLTARTVAKDAPEAFRGFLSGLRMAGTVTDL